MYFLLAHLCPVHLKKILDTEFQLLYLLLIDDKIGVSVKWFGQKCIFASRHSPVRKDKIHSDHVAQIKLTDPVGRRNWFFLRKSAGILYQVGYELDLVRYIDLSVVERTSCVSVNTSADEITEAIYHLRKITVCHTISARSCELNA